MMQATPHEYSDLPSNRPWFTSGGAAFLAQMSVRMIDLEFDKGRLHGWKVGRDRRITRESLVEWMKRRHIPLDITMQGDPKDMGTQPDDWFGKVKQ
jgi:hypothetical protein